MCSWGPAIARDTCAAFQSRLAWVDDQAVADFAGALPQDEILEFNQSDQGLSTNRFGQDVCFSSMEEEAGFIMVAHALDFGSGYRLALHKHRGGQGAWLTIRAGLVKMGQMNPRCEASWLCSLELDDVNSFFDLCHPDLGPLSQQLHVSIRELGEELICRGFATAGEFVRAHLAAGAAGMVSALVETFPITFRDEYQICGQRVAFFKKAQLVTSELYMRFHAESADFNFSDVNSLTAFVDNVVVAMLRMHGLVCTDSILAERIATGDFLEKGSEEEVALRAAALNAVERVVKAQAATGTAGSRGVNAQKLCNWLWGCVGKRAGNRGFPRHLAPSTSFY